jgi:hypothetical protein
MMTDNLDLDPCCAPAFIGQFANLVPGACDKVRLQPFAPESGLPKPEVTPPLTFRHDPPKTVFDDSLHGDVLSLGQLAHFFKKAVWYLYGCLHMANHIMKHGDMSSKEPTEP